jgi:NADH-quinone oxidoreductase subunit G
MARYRELLKVTARRNDLVNGWFICDRGRFNNTTVNAPDRPRQAQIDGKVASLDEGMDALAERILEFLQLHGPESLAVVGSPRMSHEGNIMAARLKEHLGAGALCYFATDLHAERARAAVSRLTPTNSASQEDVREADLIVIMECDLLADAPMMALAVRQAWRNGARVYIADKEREPDPALQKMFDSEKVLSLATVPFSDAKRPVIICGCHYADTGDIQTDSISGAKRAFILDNPNDFGCARLAIKYNAVSLSETLASGKIKGIISFEADIPAPAIDGITLLAATDWLLTELVQPAEIFLPVTSWIEMNGTFVNHEGRAQHFRQVMQPGLPIKGIDPTGHPPRVHRHDTPGGDLMPSYEIITELIKRCGGESSESPLSGETDSYLTVNRAEKYK